MDDDYWMLYFMLVPLALFLVLFGMNNSERNEPVPTPTITDIQLPTLSDND